MDQPPPIEAGPGTMAQPQRPLRAFETRAEFQAAWRDALAELAVQGCRELYFCDRDYADWPLGEAHTIELLTRWALPHRRLVVLAAQFDSLARQHPRWVTWRRTWSHLVQCRQVADEDIATIPSMVLAPGVLSLRLHDPVHFRGRLTHTRPEEVRNRDELDAFLQRSHESFPATSLGL